MLKISVITVCFNSAKTIRDTIESVSEQDHPAIEHIIVDGASTDSTMKIVNEYRDRVSAVISEPDRGIYDAMNKGVELAKGDAVCFLNSDDRYAHRGSLRHLAGQLETFGVDAAFADLVLVAPEDPQRIVRFYDSGSFRPARLRYGWMPAHPTLLVRRQIFGAIGGFRLNYRIAADFEWIVRLFHVAEASYVYLPEIVVIMRSGGVSTSGFKGSWVLNNEIVRACRTNGLQTSIARVLLKMPAKLLEYVKRPKSLGALDFSE